MTAFLLHQLLESSATATPDAEAVVDGDHRLTYGELDRRANQVAHLLVGAGVSAGDRVGLYLEKSLESIVGLFGVLKAGAAYVPLDPAAPPARLAYIASDCDIHHLLSTTGKASAWEALCRAGAPLEAIVLLDSGPGDDPLAAPAGVQLLDLPAEAADPGAPSVAIIDLDLAYILYTSGSTGAPKGVMLSHLNAMTFVRWGLERFSVGREDRLSNHAPLHFDLSIFDIFVASASGAALVLVPPRISVFPVEVARFIARHGITIWYSVPSILSMLVLRGGLVGGELPRLRAVLFAGEVFPTKYLRRLMELLPHARFHNLYGPTETNVCTHYEVSALPGDDDPVPIGTPITGVEVYAVTEGRRTRPGEVGELIVRGTTVMKGYWGDADRTARVLGPDPLGARPGDLVYRTGDLVREESNGYRFLGRRDGQIKSRGYRIELGEIESALDANPSVVECAVVAVPDELVTNRIKAFVSVRDETDERELVRFCAARLPKYMIPEVFELRAGLPRTSTGKIDRQALVTAAGEADGQR